jgi:hypothetical protein
METALYEVYETFLDTLTSIWTERFAETWSVGTLRLGYRWGDGTDVGGECSLTGIKGHLCFSFTAPRFASPSIQCNDGVFNNFGSWRNIGLTFLGGVYLVLNIPSWLLGLKNGDKDMLFFGILDRTEEEMAEWWPAMQKRVPLPYYEERMFLRLQCDMRERGIKLRHLLAQLAWL